MAEETTAAAAPHGFLHLLGLKRAHFAEGIARFELEAAAQHMNRMGIPHGGVYATMLDSALGAAGCWAGAPDRFRPAVTLTLNVSFIGRPQGQRLIAEGRRVGGGRSIYFSEGEVRDELGVLVAQATGSFKVVTQR
ncbi:MAG: PaaI family thioesterase [Proteobacteria bacterium]|nr:PaaI family thioesterase [Pseudomonadota bacterium]